MTDEERSPDFHRLGDEALLVKFADTISRDMGLRVRAIAHVVREMKIPSVTDVVSAYSSFAVYFTPASAFDEISDAVHLALAAGADMPPRDSRTIEIPVRYDGEDLADVAKRTRLAVDQVISLHSARTYHAYMSGFVPGFAYLGELDPSLMLPRRGVPRVRVPAGSVAIAGLQTAVYPLTTAGGWHLIGSTTTRVFDPSRPEPALIRAGDAVRFVPVPA